jgi:hypothetical protein
VSPTGFRIPLPILRHIAPENVDDVPADVDIVQGINKLYSQVGGATTSFVNLLVDGEDNESGDDTNAESELHSSRGCASSFSLSDRRRPLSPNSLFSSQHTLSHTHSNIHIYIYIYI